MSLINFLKRKYLNLNEGLPVCGQPLKPGCLPPNSPPKWGGQFVKYYYKTATEFINMSLSLIFFYFLSLT